MIYLEWIWYEVLFWALRGKDNQTIARETNIRYATVRKHLENIYSKLNVRGRTEAVAVALEKIGCLNLPSPIV